MCHFERKVLICRMTPIIVNCWTVQYKSVMLCYKQIICLVCGSSSYINVYTNLNTPHELIGFSLITDQDAQDCCPSLCQYFRTEVSSLDI